MGRKNKGHMLFWFMGLMGRRLPVYLLAIFISSVGEALRFVTSAKIVGGIVSVAQTGDTSGLAFQVAGTFLMFVLSVMTWRFGIIRYNIEARRGIARVEKMFFSKAMKLPMSYYEQHHSGDFISRLTFDMERAGDIYSSRLRRFADAIIASLVYLLFMVIDSPQLTGSLLAISFLSLLGNSLFLKPMKNAGARLARQNGVMTQQLTNLLAGMELAKIFPVGKRMVGDYEESNITYCHIQKKTNGLTAALEGLNNMFDLLGALAALGLGIWFVQEGMIGLGELTAIYTLYGSFRYAFLRIGQYLPQMMNCLANVERLYDFLQEEEEPERYQVKGGSYAKTMDEFAVTMENVCFSYGEDRKLLQDFSMKIPVGKCVALIGESGCGKSTVAKLLLGFYEPEKGRIGICGKNGNNSTLDDMRNLIAYVPQEPYLYGVTIAENIAYGRPDMRPEEVPMEDIISAAKAANAHDFIMHLPEGYKTIPGERGNSLSGGERQRIAIARAVLKNAPILLLDEATSALDNESEHLVNEALNRVCKNRTTIMIAHRASTIAMADEVIVVG